MKKREPAATYEDPKSLLPWPGNPRQNATAIEAVRASIREFGFGSPIVARRANREIIAGHTRWEAALAEGLKEVPVRFIDIDEKSAHKLALSDNRTSEIALWDDAKLAAALRELAEEGATIQLPGFDPNELSKLMTSRRTPEQEAFDSAPIPEPNTTLGIKPKIKCPECGHEFHRSY